MNWANAVTVARIAMVPLFMWFTYEDRGRPLPGSTTGTGTWLALAIFAFAAGTDSLDGYLARRFNTITKTGQFLDPLADKLLIGGALLMLVAFRGFPAWAAIVIVVREAAVSVLRTMGLRRGRSMPASWPGKVKTSIQVPMVLLWLLPRTGSVAGAQDVVAYIAVAVTVASGFYYVTKARALLAPDTGSAP